jgi:DNA-directed RNA polymerase III subunit RPC2
MRLGEMERDRLVCHGAANILYERMLLSSDAHEANTCQKCGIIGYDGYCPECRSKETMKIVWMPYACKLLFHELMSTAVAPRIRVDEM